MKLSEVQIGAEYQSRVSGSLVKVRVISRDTRHGWRYTDGTSQPVSKPAFRCKNLATGKEVTRSAAALRPLPAKRQPHPCAEEIGLLLASARYDRREGNFDRALAARELARALCAERNGGPQTRIARQAMVREFGSHW